MSTRIDRIVFKHAPSCFLMACLLGGWLGAGGSAAAEAPAADQSVAASQPANAPQGPARLVLVKGDRLAIVGDSITQQRIYSRFMEDYLTACTPELDLWVIQLGWGGETATGFLKRMDADMLSFKPTVITTCYGMNDGGYTAYTPRIGKNYARNMTLLVSRAVQGGVRAVVVGSPGAADIVKFHPFFAPKVTPAVYNDNLGKLAEFDQRIAKDHGQIYADIHDPLLHAMEAAMDAWGKDAYTANPICGDGVHPGPSGHLVMAYALLKALGCDGQIGVVTLDLANDTAQATPGHTVLGCDDGKVDLESTRYPFCFLNPADKQPNATRILPFVPFNEELNRFMLVVHGLKSAKAQVTWGGSSKTFTREQLEAGINLAAEFAQANPFTQAFAKIDTLVAQKQDFESTMIMNFYHNLPLLLMELQNDAAAGRQIDSLLTRLAARQEELRTQVKAAVVPVRHSITVTPE